MSRLDERVRIAPKVTATRRRILFVGSALIVVGLLVAADLGPAVLVTLGAALVVIFVVRVVRAYIEVIEERRELAMVAVDALQACLTEVYERLDDLEAQADRSGR